MKMFRRKGLTQLEAWLLKMSYLKENVRPDVERVNLVSREDPLKKSEKVVDERYLFTQH